MKIVTAAIIISKGKVLIARRKAGDTRQGLWEFPGGVVEPGETLRECLERELKEELGITAEVGETIAENDYRDAHGQLNLVALRATIAEGHFELSAHDSVAWVSPGDLRRYDLSPADVPIAEMLVERTDLFHP